VTCAWLSSLRNLDLSYNRCTPASFPSWVFTDTPLQGLALDGNDASLTVGAFQELQGVQQFMSRREKVKNKGVGGCWFAPGGISSFGFCGLDTGAASGPASGNRGSGGGIREPRGYISGGGRLGGGL
jgi:hypothetical protein